MDPEQTAPTGGSGSTLFAKMTLKSQADDKSEDNCCDWQFIKIHFLRVFSNDFIRLFLFRLYF